MVSSTLLSTALANTVPDEGVDIAMSISTTVWNLAIAGGGFVGGILLKGFGTASFLKVLFIKKSPCLTVNKKTVVMDGDLLCSNYKKKPDGSFDIKSKLSFFNTGSGENIRFNCFILRWPKKVAVMNTDSIDVNL